MTTPANPDSRQLRILIVEDSPTQAQRLEHILIQHGYFVTTAANGRLALDAARRSKPALIISDVIMPEMDGYELCSQVKSDASLAGIPVILVTTLSDPQDVIRGLECRADNFILKPYEEVHLLKRVRFVLANRDVQQSEHTDMGVEIFFNGLKHFITADRLQILSLLLSTYEAAMQRNKQLSLAHENLRDLSSVLEIANKELEAFSDPVSHDSRPPVRGIAEYSRRLLKESEARLSERDCSVLRHICTRAERMERLIEDLLNLSRLGRQALSATRQSDRPPQPLARRIADAGHDPSQVLNRRNPNEIAILDADAVVPENVKKGSIEEARLRAGALQNAIFKSANFSCIATDANGVVQLFNVGSERMLGYTASEVLNKVTPAHLHDPQEAIARATALSIELGTTIAPGFEALVYKASRGIEDIYELTHLRKDGSRFPAVVSVTALRDPQNSIIGYLLIGSDNTARWQVDEERRRFQQALQETNVHLEIAKSIAEKANLAKSDFLSSMSHELRSPLHAILGFAQLMQSASPSPTASQTKSIAQILQAGWYLLKLINEVLDLAVIESGKVSLSNEAVSLPELMAECRSMMEPQAQQRGIRMTFPLFDKPVFVSADRTRLKQIIINLLSNAINYNKEKGTVIVDCRTSSPERIRFSVKDTGPGLAPEKLAQLFSPFNRLGQEAGSVAGTGIGLVVSKRLAELMGGVIGVESTVGVGSVFWCEMTETEAPRVTVPASEAAILAPSEASSIAARRSLLYVEDNPANMVLVEELIARFPDIDLVTAVNGTLGIELARTAQPEVILMDINLPGISGIKALKILREDPATQHIPVIALSANAMPRDIKKGLEAGFFRYLTKPIEISEFMKTLNSALEFAEKNRSSST